MSDKLASQLAAQDEANLKRMQDISVRVREAVRAALPTPAEQFFTIMVPGKVVNFDDYKTEDSSIILPLKTELNQAILCDDMPTLSAIQMGPTGKSVSRSYSNAVSKLVSGKTTVGIDEGKPLTEEQKRYQQAIKILQSEPLDKAGKSLVEIYAEKQAKYTEAVTTKTQAFHDALKRATENPANTTKKQIREDYDKWVQENSRAYRNHVQAAYMDWVITGKKEEAEYWFSIVDQDSAMARVEQSKEAMRLAIVQDEDGSTEFQTVKLEPSDWANKCLEKMALGNNQTKSVEWYTWEVTRLEKATSMLELLKTSPPTFPPNENAQQIQEQTAAAKKELADAMSAYVTARQKYQAMPPTLTKRGATPDEIKRHNEERQAAATQYQASKKNLDEKQQEYDQLNLGKLNNATRDAQNELFKNVAKENGFADREIASNKKLIEEYTAERAKLLTGENSESKAVSDLGKDVGIPDAQPEPQPAQIVKDDTKVKAPLHDYFTPITVEVSASSEKKTTEESASSYSAGATASWGMARVSASATHSEAHSKATDELINSSVKVTFECMRVDITRSWMRPELFFDDDLVPGPGIKISPGFNRLLELMEGKVPNAEQELAMYSTFPLYPTAFLVACNVVLEVSGSTSNLETYMNTSTTSASMSVGFGPFSAHANGSRTNTNTGSTTQTTASGCRIEIKTPQIIGWISQMVPALPRLPAPGTVTVAPPPSTSVVPASHTVVRRT